MNLSLSTTAAVLFYWNDSLIKDKFIAPIPFGKPYFLLALSNETFIAAIAIWEPLIFCPASVIWSEYLA